VTHHRKVKGYIYETSAEISTADNKYSNRSKWRYGLNFIQTGVYRSGKETHIWMEED